MIRITIPVSLLAMSPWARDGVFLSTVLFIGHVTVPSAKLLLSIFLSEGLRLRLNLNLTSGPSAQSGWMEVIQTPVSVLPSVGEPGQDVGFYISLGKQTILRILCILFYFLEYNHRYLSFAQLGPLISHSFYAIIF